MRKGKTMQDEFDAASGEKKEGGPLPPRRKVHPNNKMKMVRMFYNALIFIFLLLMAGLIIWGRQFLE